MEDEVLGKRKGGEEERGGRNAGWIVLALPPTTGGGKMWARGNPAFGCNIDPRFLS